MPAGADPKTAFAPNGLPDELKKAPAERIMNAGMDHHRANEAGTGKIAVAVSQDRRATVDLQLIAKHRRRLPGFHDRRLSMDARSMKNWDEIRTAAQVARLGTISAAAEVLGVHRATVTRHIDALEAVLGAKLFQRHARGFSPTELGRELLRIADATDAQFGELFRLARGGMDDLTGVFTLTCVDVLVPTILPIIAAFQTGYPGMKVHLISSDRVLKLEYGEADIAFRIGPKPDHPDNVVLPVQLLPVGLYGPTANADRFVGPGPHAPPTPYFRWLSENVPPEKVVITSDSIAALWAAVRAGCAAGFMPRAMAEGADLVEVMAPRDEWREPIWAVTHVDLHRSAKVQAFVQVMKHIIA